MYAQPRRGRCGGSVARRGQAEILGRQCFNAFLRNKTPAGGGSGGRIMMTGNREEECRQSIAARLGGGVRGCESRHGQSFRGHPAEPGRGAIPVLRCYL